MDGNLLNPLSLQAFTEALARALGKEADPELVARFAGQIFQDYRYDELPNVTAEDLACIAAELWRMGQARKGGPASIRFAPARGADGRHLGLDLVAIVQEDAPFLLDSTIGELSAGRYETRALFHPVMQVRRDGPTLSLIAAILAPVGDDREAALVTGMTRTMADVRAAVEDFPAMTALMQRTIAELYTAPIRQTGGMELEEYLAFLRWLTADRFVFLGARTYVYPRDPNGEYAAEEPRAAEDGLGVLRDPSRPVLRRASEPALLTSQLSDYLQKAAPLTVAKGNERSRVHRRAYMDYVGVKRYGPDGGVVGEVRFVGLFTAEAYDEPVRDIPLIRRKATGVLARAGQQHSEHARKRLQNIVDSYPRDELFQVDEEELAKTALGILHLQDRPRVKLFARTDPFDRFVSVLLYTPRERYSDDLVARAGEILAEAWNGRVSAVYPAIGDVPLARAHFILGVTPRRHPTPNLDALEQQVIEAVRTWGDDFEAVVRGSGREDVADLLARYAGAFPPGYRDRFDAAEALEDLDVIETWPAEGEAIRVRAYRRAGDPPAGFRFKLYHRGSAVALADVVPITESMGLKALEEVGLPVRRQGEADEAVTWVHEFVLEDMRGEALDLDEVREPFEQTFVAVWTGKSENDGFNRMVLALGVSWREAALLRAVARYRQQSGLDPSQAVQEQSLSDYPGVGRLILDLFRTKFDPGLSAGLETRKEQAAAVFDEIVAALQQVESLDADRSLRRMALTVQAMTRTNFYRTDEDGAPRRHIAFKLASRTLADLPAPKPDREIFVLSPSVEGVHLRFGPVARGGLRWSDRRDDYRTEVLGLVKAQQVKNAVIVPVGSKGGFYPKKLTKGAPADVVRAEGVAAYKTYLHGLLDLTDNLDDAGKVIRPPAVIAHDGDDPYLVVAADKGTATFSDIANGVAADYGFWLGDAFASGGSAGYDHKAMGITARGAWESVKRHFREMGKDIQTEPFTCAGVGDMSGDVFGNGLLLSKATKLVAAFDHRHVFLDPDPDPETSWAERKRLFDLPRSSWDDYDKALISKGGGVFPRAAKEVTISAEAQALLGLETDRLSTADLVKAVLKAEVELLYLGGIGTYVKAAAQAHADAGDKANDAVRIDADELRCKVVGEGANLGFTQAGRIAFAMRGGRINTDAIDNSAGVDTSDHEVNIKILLRIAEKGGALKGEDRDALLAEMTDEIAAHVLAHNYAQTLALTLQQTSAAEDLDAHARFMAELEAAGRLDRRVEGLPGPADLAERRKNGAALTRPELAVLHAYGKLELSHALVAGSGVDDPYFARTLEGYFPTELKRFDGEMQRHRLKREIIATVLANTIVDTAGPTFPSRLMSAAACDASTLAVAFEAARQMFRLDEAWRAVSALDLKTSAECQTRLYQEIGLNLRAQTFWLARSVRGGGATVQGLIDAYRPAVDALLADGLNGLSPFERQSAEVRRQSFIEAGAPADLALTVAALRAAIAAPEVADIARAADWPAAAAGRLFHQVGEALNLDRLRAAANGIDATDYYERTALRGVILALISEQVAITRSVMASAEGDTAADPAALVAAWTARRQDAVHHARAMIDEIEEARTGWSFAKLSLAEGAMRALAETGG
jgi:glutamate dehydrogenase